MDQWNQKYTQLMELLDSKIIGPASNMPHVQTDMAREGEHPYFEYIPNKIMLLSVSKKNNFSITKLWLLESVLRPLYSLLQPMYSVLWSLYSVLRPLHHAPSPPTLALCTPTLSSVIELQNHVFGQCSLASALGNNSDKLFLKLNCP